MTAVTLGSWHNPPLAYVVAELVISPHYSIANAIPSIQDRLRNAYPRTIEGQEIVIDGNKPSAQPVWRLLSADQSCGVQLGTRAISIHSTSYAHSREFLGRWADVLDTIGAVKLGAFVERAGLRYIDLIIPSGDHRPEDYLQPGLQGVTPEGAQTTGSMWATGFEFGDCVVNLRTAAPTPHGMLLPPEFNAIPLTKPRVMLEAESRVKDSSLIGFIDTDCAKEIQKVFDAATLASIYTEMQKLVSKTFKTVLSPTAEAEWV